MRYEVGEGDTAPVLRSGDVAVLATPRLIAWMETATLAGTTPFLTARQTTVGTAVRVEHRLPTPIGDSIEIIAGAPTTTALAHRLTFTVRARDSAGTVVATGEIERAIVDRDQFPAAKPQTDPEQVGPHG